MQESADRRRVFLHLSERERFETLFDMLSYANSERVKLDARVVELTNLVERMEGELDGISHRKIDTLQLTTTEKMQAIADKSFANVLIKYYVDKVLPPTLAVLQTTIVLAIMYLAFGGKP